MRAFDSDHVNLIADRHGQNKRLRLLNLRTSKGPELHVYLSSVPAQKEWSVYDERSTSTWAR